MRSILHAVAIAILGTLVGLACSIAPGCYADWWFLREARLVTETQQRMNAVVQKPPGK